MAKFQPFQNFRGMQSMIFSKKTIRTTSKLELGRFIAVFRSQRPKTLKTVNFVPKIAEFRALMSKFWPSQNFHYNIQYNFLKEDHKGSFHFKSYENLQQHFEEKGQNTFSQKSPNLIIVGHSGGQNFLTKNFFGGHLSHMKI